MSPLKSWSFSQGKNNVFMLMKVEFWTILNFGWFHSDFIYLSPVQRSSSDLKRDTGRRYRARTAQEHQVGVNPRYWAGWRGGNATSMRPVQQLQFMKDLFINPSHHLGSMKKIHLLDLMPGALRQLS